MTKKNDKSKKKRDNPRDQFNTMNRQALEDYINKYDLSISISKTMSDDEVRNSINKFFSYSEEIEIAEAAFYLSDKDEIIKKSSQNKTRSYTEKEVNHEALKRIKNGDYNKRDKSTGAPFDPKNKIHTDILKNSIISIMSDYEIEYEFHFLAQGCKIQLVNQRKKLNLFTYKRVSFRGEEMDEIRGNFYFNPIKGAENVKKMAGDFVNNKEISFDSERTNEVWVNAILIEDIKTILNENDLMSQMVQILSSSDNAYISNRLNLEQEMRDDEPNRYNMTPERSSS